MISIALSSWSLFQTVKKEPSRTNKTLKIKHHSSVTVTSSKDNMIIQKKMKNQTMRHKANSGLIPYKALNIWMTSWILSRESLSKYWMQCWLSTIYLEKESHLYTPSSSNPQWLNWSKNLHLYLSTYTISTTHYWNRNIRTLFRISSARPK
jgi:hypothetical protein